MHLKFLGGTETVTGSKHLVVANGCHLLRDCGMFQGRRAEADRINRNLPVDPALLQMVLISHAHIDHCGMLPRLVAMGYQGPVHATRATAALCEIMLKDAAHIQESDSSYMNQKKSRRGLPPVEPLFTMKDAEDAVRLFRGHGYHEVLECAPGFTMQAFDAGHILGSALTRFELTEGGRTARVGYGVDLGRFGLPLIRDPESMGDLDVLVLESTYGNRRHDDATRAEEQLLEVAQRTLARGGKVIIPSFALERAQEVLYHLSNLIGQGRLRQVPVYLDSPMASAVTKVFDDHPEYLDADSRQMYAAMGCLTCPSWVKPSVSVLESKAITASDQPCIVIAASGMCEHGRILHHLKSGIGNPANSVVLVGFQAQHTLGRRLQEGDTEVTIFGDLFKRRAEVVSLNAFSAHADCDDLVRYVRQVRPRRTFLVHGEQEQREALAQTLRDAGLGEVFLPVAGDQVEL
jgi:metallo-beta-lactamase family protein